MKCYDKHSDISEPSWREREKCYKKHSDTSEPSWREKEKCYKNNILTFLNLPAEIEKNVIKKTF